MIWIWPTFAILLSVIVSGLAIVMLYVDDWQRDLSTNVASTSDDPKSPLPAHRSDLPPAELANQTIAAVGKLPRWRLAKLEEGKGSVTIRFVRTTPMLRFSDDIVVRITEEADGSILRAESKSRIGKGDLGQNPRNLRELLSAVEAKERVVAR